MNAGLSPTEQLLEADGQQQIALFRQFCDNPEHVQELVLLDIVRQAADTEWGRAHDYASIRSIQDFRDRAAISGWRDYEASAERMQNGERDVLFPGVADFFVLTSGTTGFAKLIPESATGLAAKRATSDTRAQALADAVPSLREGGAIMTFANRHVFGHTPAGIPYGAASGSNLTLAPPLGVERLAYPLSILERVDDAATVDYLILRSAIARDVRAIRGNNAGRLVALLDVANARRDEIVHDIRHGTVSAELALDDESRAAFVRPPNPERADQLNSAIARRGSLDAVAAWPELAGLVFWLSGSVGRFMRDLIPLVPDGITTMDIGYGASEGRFNVPLEPGVAAGPLALHGQFFEFLPMNGGAPLLAHELVEGETYGLITTSYSGLCRYDIHDLVRVDGFTGSTPNIRFESKSGDVANIAGEKLPGGALMHEVEAALAEVGLRARHFCVVTDLDAHRYDLCVEPADPDGVVDPRLPAVLDEALGRVAVPYTYFRNQGLIAPPRVLVMAAGWQDALYEAATGPGVTRAQVKLHLIELTVPRSDLLRSVHSVA